MLIWFAIGAVLAALTVTLPLRWAAGITIVCLPLAGTAVAMVGADPIVLPLVVASGFVLRHAFSLLSKPLRDQFVTIASNDLLLIAFAAYCVVSALVFPRVFAGDTTVIPQTGQPVTLGPGQTSVVQLIYMLIGLYLYLAMRQTMLRRGLEFIVVALLVQVGLFAGFGLIQAMLGLAHVPVSTGWIVNNHAYALLTQVTLGGFARVTSVFVEASSYAAWATGALAFCYGLYINRVLPTFSLAMLALVGVTMILSTSSTAYAGLLVVGAFAMVYSFLDNDRARHERGFLIVLAGAFVAITALIVVYSAQDGFLVGLRNMIEEMTVRKSQSSSGVERAQWAQSAVQNALDTGLLGVGYGAARSSGLIYQLLGTVGAPGLVMFALAMAALARRMFRKLRTGDDGVVCAGAFAMVCALGGMAASSSDLSLWNLFWMYGAIAAAPLAQRAAMLQRRQAQEENGASDGDVAEGRA